MKSLTGLLILWHVKIIFSYSCSTGDTGDTLCRLSATEDVFVYDSSNQNNFNFLIVGLHPGFPLKRTLLKFEDIPSTCQVLHRATMYVHYWYAHKASYLSESEVPWIPRPIQARQVLRSWRDTQATRDVRLVNTPWSRPYLNLNDADARMNVDDTQTISRSNTAGYISWNITTSARNWLAGQPNNGILLSAANDDVFGREIRFYSRERSTANLVPYLEIHCTSDRSDKPSKLQYNALCTNKCEVSCLVVIEHSQANPIMISYLA